MPPKKTPSKTTLIKKAIEAKKTAKTTPSSAKKVVEVVKEPVEKPKSARKPAKPKAVRKPSQKTTVKPKIVVEAKKTARTTPSSVKKPTKAQKEDLEEGEEDEEIEGLEELDEEEEEEDLEEEIESDDDIEEGKKGKTSKRAKTTKRPTTRKTVDLSKKRLLLEEEHTFKPVLPALTSPPFKKIGEAATFSSKLVKAKIPDIDLTLSRIPIPEFKLEKGGVKTVTPTGVKKYKENTGHIINILKEIEPSKLMKREGKSKKQEYRLPELKVFLSRMGERQNMDRNNAVKKILEKLKIHSVISNDEYNQIYARVESKMKK